MPCRSGEGQENRREKFKGNRNKGFCFFFWGRHKRKRRGDRRVDRAQANERYRKKIQREREKGTKRRIKKAGKKRV